MVDEVFTSLVELTAADERRGFGKKVSNIVSEFSASGRLHSGATVLAVTRIGIESLNTILNKTLAVMPDCWKKFGRMGLDLTGNATKEISRHKEFVEKKLEEFFENRFSEREWKPHVEKEFKKFEEFASGKIKNTFNCVQVGIDPIVGEQKGTASSSTSIIVQGNAVINSTILGDLNQSIEKLSKANPDLGGLIQEVLEAVTQIKDSDPDKYQESIDLISGLSDEVGRPEDKKRVGVINNMLEGISKISGGISGGEKIVGLVNKIAEYISSSPPC